jgi:hypothetical protein
VLLDLCFKGRAQLDFIYSSSHMRNLSCFLTPTVSFQNLIIQTSGVTYQINPSAPCVSITPNYGIQHIVQMRLTRSLDSARVNIDEKKSSSRVIQEGDMVYQSGTFGISDQQQTTPGHQNVRATSRAVGNFDWASRESSSALFIPRAWTEGAGMMSCKLAPGIRYPPGYREEPRRGRR